MEAGAFNFNKDVSSFNENPIKVLPGNDLDTNKEEGWYLIFLTFCAVENNADRKKIVPKPQILFQ